MYCSWIIEIVLGFEFLDVLVETYIDHLVTFQIERVKYWLQGRPDLSKSEGENDKSGFISIFIIVSQINSVGYYKPLNSIFLKKWGMR